VAASGVPRFQPNWRAAESSAGPPFHPFPHSPPACPSTFTVIAVPGSLTGSAGWEKARILPQDRSCGKIQNHQQFAAERDGMDGDGGSRMKIVWRPWHCLWIGLAAGCASSTADQTEQRANRAATEPEWVHEEDSATPVTLASRIQPIPDASDDGT